VLSVASHGGSQAHDVDLLVRSGGEQRLSDFLLWECAYAELVFSPVLWPDFGIADLKQAVAEFRTRERRFGLLPDMLSPDRDDVAANGSHALVHGADPVTGTAAPVNGAAAPVISASAPINGAAPKASASEARSAMDAASEARPAKDAV
jgi:hypothetical protein